MKIFLSSLFVAFSFQSLAAIPTKTTQIQGNLDLAQEILSMPEANRLQIARKKSEELYPALIILSKSSDQAMETRWKALTLAASIGNNRGLNDIESYLKSPEWFMRNAALVSLQAYHPKRAKIAAQNLLKDKALVVRSAAVEVLGANLDARTRDILWEEFNSKYNYRKEQSLWIRGQILSQLAQAPLEKEGSLFLKALQEKDATLHSSAMLALEKITQRSLGKANQKISEKRALWLKWAKANSEIITN